MEEYFCNICERSIEKHTKESEHIARKNILEKQLGNNSKFQKSLRSAADLWKTD